ncbi:MAG: phasin family protein [Betaproteobacteria bacterium]|nr:phasin family protein [Betaproteobacteria bacterium]MBL8532645.1 phasin family protein [Betaproteobacteria bacterium]
MSFTTPDFTGPAKAQFDAAVRAASITSDGVARLLDLNTKTARAAFDEFTGAFQAVASAKDPADLRTLASKAFKPDFETTQAYARTVYEQVSATQSELASLVETQVTEFNKQMVVALDGLLKSAPAGSEAFVSAFKSAITTANQAYESSLHAFKDVGSTINATVASVQPVSTKRKAA